eukprot:7966965-Pyramimonas_sp.AAC.1
MESPPHASTNAPPLTPAVRGMGCPPSASQSAPTPSVVQGLESPPIASQSASTTVFSGYGEPTSCITEYADFYAS